MKPAWDATKAQIEKDMIKEAEKTMAALIKQDAKRLKKVGHLGY